MGRGNINPALSLYEQGLKLSRQTGNSFMIALASEKLGDLFSEQGNYEKAGPLIDQQLKINESLQFRLGIAGALISLGDLHRHQGDYIQAEQCFEKSLRISRNLGLKGHISLNLYLLSLLSLHQNDYLSTMLRLGEYFNFAQMFYEKISACRFLTVMSAVAAGTNQPEHCAKLFGAAQAMCGTLDFRIPQFDRIEFDQHIQIAREQLGSATFDRLSNEGRTMTMEQAIAFASEETHE